MRGESLLTKGIIMYRNVVIETYQNTSGGSKHSIRARPVAGQGFPTTMRVECSSAMREKYPIGTIFLVRAKIKDTEQQAHLYTSWQWAFRVLSAVDALEIISSNVKIN